MANAPIAQPAATPAGTSRDARGLVFGVNGVVSLLIVVLVAAIALVFNPPAPPSIAEFAPQAAKTINKAPPNQNSNVGANGACAAGQHCKAVGVPTQRPKQTAATGPLKPIGVPSELQCFTWPDGSVTQTFDPQSPPCVATWPDQAKGNGGATSPGVTGTDIRIGFPQDTSGDQLSIWPYVQPFVDFVNSHFELYGRKILLVPFSSQQANNAVPTNQAASPTYQKADARTAGTQHLFASMDFVDPTGQMRTTQPWLDTLASEKIIAVTGGNSSPLLPTSDLVAHAPYVWTYAPAITDLWTAGGSVVCRQLRNGPAVHSTEFKSTARKYAVLVPDATLTGDQVPGVNNLLQQFSSCGLPKPTVVTYYDKVQQDQPELLQLKNDGVTTLIQYTDWGQGNTDASTQAEANHVNYFPEWFDLSWFQNNAEGQTENGSGQELLQTFGIAAWNKAAPYLQEPWAQTYTQGGGQPSETPNLGLPGQDLYHELLLLASGIQMAGANLTPQTFADALHRTQFPNPGAAAAPFYQATVGFPGSSVTMMQDLAGWWYDPANANAASFSASGNQANNDWQAFCYVGLGRRWGIQDWPKTDAFIQGGCR